MKTNKDLIIEPNAAIEGRKYSEEKPWSCKYCYWWGGKKKGCSLKQCHYLPVSYTHLTLPTNREV